MKLGQRAGCANTDVASIGYTQTIGEPRVEVEAVLASTSGALRPDALTAAKTENNPRIDSRRC